MEGEVRPVAPEGYPDVEASPSDLHTLLTALDALVPMDRTRNYAMILPAVFESRDHTAIYVKRRIATDEGTVELDLVSPSAIRVGAEVDGDRSTS